MKLENRLLNDGQDWMIDCAMFGYVPVAEADSPPSLEATTPAAESLLTDPAPPAENALNLTGPLAIAIAVLTVVGFVVLDFSPKLVLPLTHQSSHHTDALPMVNPQLSSTHLPSIARD